MLLSYDLMLNFKNCFKIKAISEANNVFSLFTLWCISWVVMKHKLVAERHNRRDLSINNTLGIIITIIIITIIRCNNNETIRWKARQWIGTTGTPLNTERTDESYPEPVLLNYANGSSNGQTVNTDRGLSWRMAYDIRWLRPCLHSYANHITPNNLLL